MSNLAVVQQVSAVTRAAMPPGMVIQSLADVITIGRILAASRFFKDATNESQAVAKILRGWELGIPPVAALENIHVIDGKTSLSVHLVSAKISESARFRQRVVQHTPELCAIRFDEKVDGTWEEAGISEFTIAEAKIANLLSKKNWQQYPKAMLYARALSQGARWFCAPVFMGQVYVPDELGAETNESGEVIDVITPVYASNSERIGNLLTEVGITDPQDRKTTVDQHLQGRKAADLSDEELEQVLSSIRAASASSEVASPIDRTRTVEEPEISVIPDESEIVLELVSNRSAISNLLDELGVADAATRQRLGKQALSKRKVENLDSGELEEVLKAIRQAHSTVPV